MTRRWTLLAGALALTLSTPQAATALAPQQPGVRAAPAPDDSGADRALRRLQADAEGVVRVHRGPDGGVDSVSSADGRAMVEAQVSGTPARTAADQLARYGEAFGIDGDRSRAVVKRTLPSATGGSVVRADQVVDGVPVFGGQLVMSLDEDRGVVSVDAATTGATQVPAAVVPEAKALRTALAVTAKTHRVRATTLTATGQGRRLYDPALVHTSDPMGVRPVWEFEVGNGSDIRETVLVGSGRGEVALHFNDAPAVNRTVCDNAEAKTVSSTSTGGVPQCTTAAVRTEGGSASPVADVNAAYDNLGATADAYAQLGGIDLTQTIGATVAGQKALMSTVRWCFTDADLPCPYTNAFWDGTQMVFGTGYAGADDVVGHELTHGFVERTAALFYLHQSGAINESLADVIGEIVDHRNPATPGDDSAWTVGEDLPGGGAIRSLKDPTLFGQPDRMTSPEFVTADVFYDNGAVHDNDGVGNKTAYLISQGGSFNGRTVTGIDGADTGLAKTGRLYLETIPRLTSGAEYADLGRVLVSTCDQLAASATAGFTSATCSSVRTAVDATELALQPTDPDAAAPELAQRCPAGTYEFLEKRDDDGVDQIGFSQGGLWQRTPDNGSPSRSYSGASSLFGWDPDPTGYGDPPSSSLASAGFTVGYDGPSFLSFHHAYVFEFYPASGGNAAAYYDGGQVLIQKLEPDGTTWTTQENLPWVNGPDKLIGSSTPSFGGDSRGYGTSRVDLSSLKGQQLRVLFRVHGDADVGYLGWWIDDLRFYSCPQALASAPQDPVVKAATTSATYSWMPPAHPGKGVKSYRVTRSDGKVTSVAAPTAWVRTTTTLSGLNPGSPLKVTVAAVNPDGGVGAGTSRTINPTSTTTTSSVARARKNRYFTVTGKVVRRGTTSAVAGMPVLLQRRLPSQGYWTNVATGTTSSGGTRGWSVRQSKATYYRVVARGVTTWFGSTSGARAVKMR